MACSSSAAGDASTSGHPGKVADSLRRFRLVDPTRGGEDVRACQAKV